jgi:hypothetical protein
VATASGIGTLQAALQGAGRDRGGRRGHALRASSGAAFEIGRPGRLKLRVLVPPADRRPGTYLIHVRTTSPDGKGHATATLRLQIGS